MSSPLAGSRKQSGLRDNTPFPADRQSDQQRGPSPMTTIRIFVAECLTYPSSQSDSSPRPGGLFLVQGRMYASTRAIRALQRYEGHRPTAEAFDVCDQRKRTQPEDDRAPIRFLEKVRTASPSLRLLGSPQDAFG